MADKASNGDQAQPDQGEVFAFLADPGSHPGSPASVPVLETHAAKIFLAGDMAYKVKKAVELPYLDFSSLDKRKATCVHELKINQPHAPMIYLDVVDITREGNGRLAIDGRGEPVECALRMRRFPDDALLADLVASGKVTADLLDRLADEIAGYHASAPVVPDGSAAGRLGAIVDELCAAFRQAGDVLPFSEVGRFEASVRHALAQCGSLLDDRGRTGDVRRCHGDLHLSNIVVLDDQPVLFDAIEFNDEIATVDILYDLAFLLMDLGHRNELGAANRILNRYLTRHDNTDQLTGLRALPLFMCCRAGVRSMVAVTRAQQSHAAATSSNVQEAVDYLIEATGLLDEQPARLVAIGGLSGTGKTSVARALAARIARCPGAVHLRTDVERKKMFGVAETTKLPADTYTRETSDRVYTVVFEKAAAALTAGHPVIVDAVFLEPAERSAIENVAVAAGAGFAGVWLEAPVEVLVKRVSGRTGDASDATADVVHLQTDRPTGSISWSIVDAGDNLEQTIERAMAVL